MALTFLENQSQLFPEMSEHFNELKNLYQKKLYHQLSQKLQSCLKIPFFQANDTLIHLYDNFVCHVQTHIDQVEIALFTIETSKQFTKMDLCIEFLEKISKVVEENDEAKILILCELAQCELDIKPDPRMEKCEKKLENAEKLISDKEDLKGIVYSAFYRVLLQFYKIKIDALKYYKSALLFLSYTDLTQITESDRLMLASDIGAAALVGNVYKFGELLQHPILEVLKGTTFDWLGQLLDAFYCGDIEKFNIVFEKEKETQSLLRDNEIFLQQKIRLMCLIDLIFKRDVHDRIIHFDIIAKHCHLQIDEVEMLLMEGLCLEIIKGTIDQVKKSVEIRWVQPRFLNLDQIGAMRDTLDGWSTSVLNVVQFLESQRKSGDVDLITVKN